MRFLTMISKFSYNANNFADSCSELRSKIRANASVAIIDRNVCVRFYNTWFTREVDWFILRWIFVSFDCVNWTVRSLLTTYYKSANLKFSTLIVYLTVEDPFSKIITNIRKRNQSQLNQRFNYRGGHFTNSWQGIGYVCEYCICSRISLIV